MGKSTEDYVANIATTLKNVAKDNAVRMGGHDEGYNVVITKEDIKQGTDRSRIKEPVIVSIVDELNSEGFEAEANEGKITVFVPPILGNKDIFTLDEISERESVIEEINIREGHRLTNE